MSLVPIRPDVCPDCDSHLRTGVWEQPAVIRHAGYGATRRTVFRWCPRCTWSLLTEIREVR